ncbi:hypothetical protein [Vannielia litorea]|uniref:Uncharacterized protein n=1 Tax=Vannielia litorea TaxID=1217970 RepID=A0A1N6GW00_9RHOB|nr:hypothetical protein [Vannielia litorea]SIO11545.1 hypothetical protein SAMN05444002_2819 [Vannielia litorea]
MTANHSQLRQFITDLEKMREMLSRDIVSGNGDTRMLTDLHRRVSKALTALNGQA